jgi:hypothetical protein
LTNIVENDAVGDTVQAGRDEMGSLVEGLKLRRMRVRNEISFNRNTEGEPERAEDLEALREELHRLSKQIEEAGTLLGCAASVTARSDPHGFR